jgi:hypothetical protein
MSSERDGPVVLEKRPARHREDVALWVGALAGPIVYFLDFAASYLVVSVVEAPYPRKSAEVLIHVFTLLGLALVIASGVVAHRVWKRHARDEEQPNARVRFMAAYGMATAIFFSLVIVANAVPKFLLRIGD